MHIFYEVVAVVIHDGDLHFLFPVSFWSFEGHSIVLFSIEVVISNRHYIAISKDFCLMESYVADRIYFEPNEVVAYICQYRFILCELWKGEEGLTRVLK